MTLKQDSNHTKDTECERLDPDPPMARGMATSLTRRRCPWNVQKDPKSK